MRKSAILLLLICLSAGGCIRLTGSAGYWNQGEEDEFPEVHQAGFDTARMIPAKADSK